MAKIIKLSNGQVVCYQRKKGSLSCAFGIFVNAGSRDEGKDNNGIAHFIEHMTFKGTEKRTAFEIANELDKLGAHSNAYTSRTNTVYYVGGLGKYFEKYLDVMSDMFFNSTYTDENIEKEKGVVLEEIKMYDDEGDSLCSDLLNKKFFDKDALSNPILGTEKTVKKLTRQDILDFVNKFYTVDNVCLSYVGALSEKELRDLLEKYFVKPYEKRPNLCGKKTFRSKKKKTGFFTITNKPFEQANVMIRFPSVGIENPMSDAMGTMSLILGGGMSSRLFQKIREENGLVYEIYSNSVAIKGAGYFDVCFATTPEQAVKAVQGIREVMEEVKQKGFTQEEFDKVKIQRESGAVLGSESGFDEMRLMGRYYLLTGKLVTHAKLLKKLEKVTFEDVNKAFIDTVDYQKTTVSYVGKEIKEDLREVLIKG